MLYNSLKILHIFSATLLLTSMSYCIFLWSRSLLSIAITIATSRIQTQTWLVILPMAMVQLISGFTMMSLKHENFSQSWIIGSVIGFIIVIGSWFSFTYLFMQLQHMMIESQNDFLKCKSLQYLQAILLCICASTLLVMIFLMANKIN